MSDGNPCRRVIAECPACGEILYRLDSASLLSDHWECWLCQATYTRHSVRTFEVEEATGELEVWEPVEDG